MRFSIMEIFHYVRGIPKALVNVRNNLFECLPELMLLTQHWICPRFANRQMDILNPFWALKEHNIFITNSIVFSSGVIGEIMLPNMWTSLSAKLMKLISQVIAVFAKILGLDIGTTMNSWKFKAQNFPTYQNI